MATLVQNTGPAYEPVVLTRSLVLGGACQADVANVEGQLWPRGSRGV